jgi:hypothetical protein
MATTGEAVELARAVARRLAPELGRDLEGRVEQVLAASGDSPQRFEAVSIAIASLIVSVAGLGWQIYRDLKQDRENRDARAAAARRLRVQVELPPDVTPAQRDRVIEAVLDELDGQIEVRP